ncbi:MAG TPA: hypothetical protein VNS58_07240 [Puia sp.]|nr:hypothetical protein [Puia sp.]
MTSELRLGSVVAHGVGGPETGAINIIYSYLLSEFNQDHYRYIWINQVGEELNELILKAPNNKIHINIRYPVYEDFDSKSVDEKNRIRLDVIHTALLQLAKDDKKLDVQKLEAIRRKILDHNFSFEFICKSFVCQKQLSRVASVVVCPEITMFNYYVMIEEEGKIICRLWIYSGLTDIICFSDFFSQGKWKGDNELVITGKVKEVEISIIVNECKAEFKNLTPYPKPPQFEMMKSDISKEEMEHAHKEWMHSLPPAVASVIRKAHN